MCRTANAELKWDTFLQQLGRFPTHIRLVLRAATRGSFELMHPRELPPPDAEFLPQCATRYQTITRQPLAVAELDRAYQLLGRRPGHLVSALVDACGSHSAGIMDAAQACARRMESAPHAVLALNALSEVELAVLRRVLEGKELFSKAAVLELRSVPGVSRLTNGALVQRAVHALMRLGILYPVGRAAYELESPAYQRILRGNNIPSF